MMNGKAEGAQHGAHHAKRTTPKRQERRAQEVWATNLEEEMANIRDAVETYSHVAAEVLLPKVVAEPMGPFGDYSEYNYQVLRCNIDLTRALQISLTLSDAKGNRPKGTSTWRFNFDYNPNRDFFLQETLDILCHSCGVDLGKHHTQGINAQQFGEQLMSSGMVLSEDVKWIAFCGASGLSEAPPRGGGAQGRTVEPPERRFYGMYSFGYLLQLLTSQEMPDAIEGFVELMDLFFPSRCDLSEHVQQLPQLNGRDPADPQKRPFFCNAQHLLDGFFRLPEAVRRIAFDKTEEGERPAALPFAPPKRQHRRRHHRDRDGEASGTKSAERGSGSAAAVVNGGADVGATTADAGDCGVNGAAKTGGG